MPVRCQSEAEDALGRHFGAWGRIVLDSVQSGYAAFGHRLHALELWTQRSIIRDEIKERLIAYWDTTPGLHWERRGNSTLFGAHSEWLIKPKKLNDALRANVGKTQLALGFDRNIPPQTELLTDADATTLYLGWVPTENSPLTPPVYIVCNNDFGRLEWAIDLTPAPPDAPVRLEPEVVTSAGGEPPRVVVKPGAQKRARNE